MIAIILVLFVIIMGFVVLSTMDVHEDWLIIYKYTIIFLAIASLCFYTPYKVTEFSCKQKATAQGLDYKFGLFEGCLVKEKDGNYIDYNIYRVVKQTMLNNKQKEVRMPCGSKKPTTKKPPKK